jgi:glycosyltransferase involved in cell wall biosynthesis
MPVDVLSPRVLLIIANFASGGAERVIISIANSLASRHEVALMVFDGQGPLKSLVSEQVKIYDLGVPRVRNGTVPYVRAIFNFRPSVIVSTLTHVNFFVLLFSFLFPRIPVIVREAITPDYFEKHKYFSLIKFLYRVLYRRAKCVVAPTSLAINQLQLVTKLPQEKFLRILNPVNFSDFKLLDSISRDKAAIRFVCSGRLDHQKGFDRLISGLGAWASKNDWSLDIYGEGRERSNLENLILKYNLCSHITLKGLDVNARFLYGEYDYFLLPSRFEGLPNVALEALAQGTKVIAMKEAGGIYDIRELAQSNSVIICDSMDQFIDKMSELSLASNKSYKKENFLSSDFELSHIVSQYEALILKVIKSCAV